MSSFFLSTPRASLLAAATTIVDISRWAHAVATELHRVTASVNSYRYHWTLYLSGVMMRYMDIHDLCLGQPPRSSVLWFTFEPPRAGSYPLDFDGIS